MTATFCNVPTSPNTSGYGSSGASASSAAVRIERQRWHQHHPALPGVSAGQRTVQLKSTPN
jgi:hypothetical protein